MWQPNRKHSSKCLHSSSKISKSKIEVTHQAECSSSKRTAGTTKSSEPTDHLLLKTTIPGIVSRSARGSKAPLETTTRTERMEKDFPARHRRVAALYALGRKARQLTFRGAANRAKWCRPIGVRVFFLTCKTLVRGVRACHQNPENNVCIYFAQCMVSFGQGRDLVHPRPTP